MELKAGQLIRNTGTSLCRVGLVTKVYQSRPEFVPQALIYWLYYKDSSYMVGKTIQFDTRRIHSEGPRCSLTAFEIMQDEAGKPAPLLK